MIAEIAPIIRLPLALPCLDYLIPLSLGGKIRPGQLVFIPFRGKEIFGIVKCLRDDTSVDLNKLKKISSICSPVPLIPVNLLDYYTEISEFYRAPLGFILKSALLPLKKRKIASVISTISNPRDLRIFSPQRPSFISYQNNEERKKCIEKISHRVGQRLILVPEAGQPEECLLIIPENQRHNCLLVSGELGDKEYFDIWVKVRNSADIIVIGTRKALFLPWINLTSITLDDEGNPDYKSWDMAPRYHARDAALMLSKHTGAKLELLSSAPSVETYYFVKNKVYDGVAPLKNISEPSPIFINPSDEKRTGSGSPLAEEIIEKLKQVKNEAFIFVNRRGTSGSILCRDCGFVFRCDNCNRPQTYYKKTNSLACHFCSTSRPLPAICPACNGVNYRMGGIGTEGVTEYLKKTLGARKNILAIDKDNGFHPDSASDGRAKIVVGTEYAWPHVNWKKLEMFVMADADLSLSAPDYRSLEDLWQILRRVQISTDKKMLFFIQTSHPEHPLFQGIYEPNIFYEAALKERKLFGYPPFCYITRLYHGAATKSEAERSAAALYERLTKAPFDVRIAGPISASPPYYRQRFWQILILKFSYSNYKNQAKNLLKIIPDEWKVDPNPNNILSIS